MDLNQVHYFEDICSCDVLLLKHGHNFRRSDLPLRIMFYMNNSWHDFKGETLESLRHGFIGGKTMLPLKIEGVMYTFDFLRMQQIHKCSGYWRSISWIDEKGNCFFPEIFFNPDLSLIPSKASAIFQDVPNQKGKRKIHPEEVFDGGSGGPKQKSLAMTSKFPNAKQLSKNDNMYKYTIDLFFSNIAKVDMHAVVTDIHEFQISGAHGRARWDAFEKQIEITEAMRGKANVVYGWYAAPTEKVASIFSHGFELVPNPPALRPSFGAGIFLAGLESPQHRYLHNSLNICLLMIFMGQGNFRC